MGIREERLARASSMPHRAAAGEDAIDARLESTVGRFFYHGHITQPEFEAGIRYGKIILDYLTSIDAPSPYGDGFDDMSDSRAFNCKILATEARQILKDAAEVYGASPSKVIAVVDRLTVYGEPPQGEAEMRLLHIGLRALSHDSNVVQFRR